MSLYFVEPYTDGPATRWNVIDRQTQGWVRRFPTKEAAEAYAACLEKKAPEGCDPCSWPECGCQKSPAANPPRVELRRDIWMDGYWAALNENLPAAETTDAKYQWRKAAYERHQAAPGVPQEKGR